MSTHSNSAQHSGRTPDGPAPSPASYRYLRYALIAAGYLLTHLLLDRLSLQFQTSPGVTVWYPPDGLSFALLLAFGPAFAPVCLVAELVSNFFTYQLPIPPLSLALWSVFIVSSYAGVAALLRRRRWLNVYLRSLRDVAVFTLAAGFISLTLALIVVVVFGPPGHALSEYANGVYQWWVGEAIGLFTVTPFVLVVVAPWLKSRNALEQAQLDELRRQWQSRSGLLFLVFNAVSIALVLVLVFRSPFNLALDLPYLAFLPLIWITLRDGVHGAVTAALAISVGATLLSLADNTGLTSITALQVFMLVLSLTGLVLGALVTQRTEVQDAYRVLVEESLQGLLVIQRGRVVFGNRAAAETLALSQETMLSLPPAAVLEQIATEDRAQVAENLAAVLAGRRGNQRFEARFCHSDGTAHWLEVAVSRIAYRDAAAVQAALIDVTQVKQAAADAQKRIHQLTAISVLGTALSEVLDLSKIYARLFEAVLAVMPDSEGMFVSLFDQERAEIRCVFAYNRSEPIEPSSLPPLPLAAPGAGTQSEVVHTKRPLIVNDLGQIAPRLSVSIEIGSGDSPQSGLYVPMLAGDEIIGVVQVQSLVADRYNAEDADMLTLVANTAAVAIQNARLLADAQRHLAEEQALHDIDLAILANLELRHTLAVVLEKVKGRLEVDAADVLLLDRSQQLLEYGVGLGFRGRGIEQSQLRLDQGDVGPAVLERRVVRTPDLASADANFSRASLVIGEDLCAHYAAPLIARDRVIGVLEIFQRAQFEPDPGWLDFFQALASQTAIAIDNATLFDDLERSNAELTAAYDATIQGWSKALDLRDKETEGHTQRVTELTLRLARALGLPEGQMENIRRGGLLHDIGKMGVPDSILLKPGPLTDAEMAVMRQHPRYAYEMLSPITYLSEALDIPYAHHEKWDGTGYPRGLAGTEIPLTARIFAVVDVWDALRSDRPYRNAWPAEKVREHIRSLANSHFDARVVEVFLGLDVENIRDDERAPGAAARG